MNFNDVLERWPWKPIPHCPGRYVLQDAPPDLPPHQVLTGEVEAREFQTSKARDTVVVVRFEGGGLISYRRADGSYRHTLNTPEGFRRKLDQLGLPSDLG